MPTIQTARGPIDSSQLGTTLMHEHVFILDTEIQHNYPPSGAVKKNASPMPSRASTN